MDIGKLRELLSDDTKKKQAVLDKYCSQISNYIESELITLKVFYNKLETTIKFSHFERMYYRSIKRLNDKSVIKKEKNNIEKKETEKPKHHNSSKSEKIIMSGVSDKLLNEIISYGFNEDDIRSWFGTHDYITSISLRKKFNEIKWQINGEFAKKTTNDFKA